MTNSLSLVLKFSIPTQIKEFQAICQHLVVQLVGNLQVFQIVQVDCKVEHGTFPSSVRLVHVVLRRQVGFKETRANHVTCGGGKIGSKLVEKYLSRRRCDWTSCRWSIYCAVDSHYCVLRLAVRPCRECCALPLAGCCNDQVKVKYCCHMGILEGIFKQNYLRN